MKTRAQEVAELLAEMDGLPLNAGPVRVASGSAPQAAAAMTRAQVRARNARAMTNRAIARGQLVPGPCEQCGAVRVHAHHDDYAKPLEVRWLCPAHHALHHATEQFNDQYDKSMG